MANATRRRRWWTAAEDNVLRSEASKQAKGKGDLVSWSNISALLPGRTNKDCRKRWDKIRLDIKKGAWTSEEDRKLTHAVGCVGTRWASVATMMESRNADQCSKRWHHVLDPNFTHESWTVEEDLILQNATAKYGNNWKQVATLELPGRSTHDIRNRSVTLNRRKSAVSTCSSEPVDTRTPDSTEPAVDDAEGLNSLPSEVLQSSTMPSALFRMSSYHDSISHQPSPFHNIDNTGSPLLAVGMSARSAPNTPSMPHWMQPGDDLNLATIEASGPKTAPIMPEQAAPTQPYGSYSQVPDEYFPSSWDDHYPTQTWGSSTALQMQGTEGVQSLAPSTDTSNWAQFSSNFSGQLPTTGTPGEYGAFNTPGDPTVITAADETKRKIAVLLRPGDSSMS